MLKTVTAPLLAAALAMTLSGCGLGEGPDPREQAQAAVTAEMERRFPGVDVSPVVDCVMTNATLTEIYGIAGNVAIGNDAAVAQSVAEITQRPETLRCMAVTVIGRALL